MSDEPSQESTDNSDVPTKDLDDPSGGEEDEQASAGMHGYESEHNPGERVRVARMTDDVSSESEPSAEPDDDADGDGDDDGEGERVQVTVRGDGPSEEEREADEAGTEAEAARKDAPPAGDDQSSSDSPESREEPPTETLDDAGDSTTGGETSPDGETERSDTASVDAGHTAHAEPGEFEDDQDLDIEEFSPDLDLEDEEGETTTEDFASMLEQQGLPDQGDYESGDRIEGEVLEIGERFIFVELDPHTEGVAKRREFETDEGELEVSVGDTAEFYVTYVGDDEVELGRQLEGNEGSLDAIREAERNGLPVEGKVTGTNKGGFDVEVHGVDAFCPISEIEIGFTEEKEVHVGATYRFKVTEVRDGGDTVVLSRSELLEEERAEKARETLESLEEGDVVEGIVTRTANFGAFVDLGGVEGLVHVSDLSHRHFDHPDDVVDEGERIEVEVLEIEEPGEDEDPGEQARISLSHQTVEEDPWERVNEQFAVGENVEGRVVRNAPFGAFIEIAPGVEGLCHVSEMSWTEHVRTPDDIVEPGDKVTVQVQDIDIPRKRIGLSLREAEGDPWDEVSDTYRPGDEVQGTVENIEDFGAFIQLPTGITALMPRSEMNLPSGVTPHRKFDRGETVTAEIMNIDPAEREMAVAPPSDEDAEVAGDETDEETAPPPQAAEPDDSGGSFGTLGDMIGDDLKGED